MSELQMLSDRAKQDKEYRLRLIENEQKKLLGRTFYGRLPMTNQVNARIRQSAIEIYSIMNADFGENYNPHHGDQR